MGGIVHRDLKPENILCVEDSIKKVKIADFGISAIIGDKSRNDDDDEDSSNDNKTMKTRVGTLSYTAPEILSHQAYDKRVDYWSLGVLMYILVCGYPPFDGDNDYEVSDAITNESVDFESDDWAHVSSNTKQLVGKLLSKHPQHRANCNDIIKMFGKCKCHTLDSREHTISSKRLSPNGNMDIERVLTIIMLNCRMNKRRKSNNILTGMKSNESGKRIMNKLLHSNKSKIIHRKMHSETDWDPKRIICFWSTCIR